RPMQPAPRLARGRQMMLGTAVLITLLVGLLILIEFSKKPAELPSKASSTRVAVFPFSVRGSAALSYLSEGMVDLFSTKLDGAGEWRTVDPRAVMSLLSQRGVTTISPEESRTIAEQLGAGRYVLGNILEIGGRLHLEASLYDLGRDLEAVSQGSAEGEASQIFELVDDVASHLLVAQSGGSGARFTQLAALTTASLPALKAYLEGESAGRNGLFPEAVDAFSRAVSEDSTFALAYYRLSIAAEWDLQEEMARKAAEQAFRYSGRLSDRDRRLLEAYLVRRRGANAEAEQVYRSILGTYPNDVEVWIDLAEILIHANPLRGRSFVDSREAFEKILSYDPRHATSLIHLARIAAYEQKAAELDSLVERFIALSPTADRTLELLALRAFFHSQAEEENRVMALLEEASELALALAVWDVGLYAQNIEGAARLTRLLTKPDRSIEGRTLGHAWLSHLHLARGQWTAAQNELAAMQLIDPASALEYRALFYGLSFLPVPRSDVVALREAMTRLDPETVPVIDNPSVVFSAHNGMHGILKSYFLGRLSVHLDDTSDANQKATYLHQLVPPPSVRSLADDLALSIKAQIYRRQGRTAEALTALEQSKMETWYGQTMASPYFSQAYERFARAELLVALGRDNEALHWYSYLAETSIFELVYLPIAHLRRAEIHERMGQQAKAVEQYRRFIDLWKNCDSELQPRVDEAQQLLDGLLNGKSVGAN
ncbi:hypothetical protein MJD09_11510, partial [bacterium]|nr:hypothetical protein [bacterium]